MVRTKSLSLIDTLVLLHDKTRLRCRGKENPFERSAKTIADAEKLAHQILEKNLKRLPKETRLFFLLIEKSVENSCKILKIKVADYLFTEEQIAGDIGWSIGKIRNHLKILKVHGYIREQSPVYRMVKNSHNKRRVTTLKI